MQTIILIGIIAECLLLLFFAVFKKMTRKTFVIISAITALCCSVAIFITLGQDQREEPEDKSKGYIYMASRLLEEGHPEDALTALGQISETEGNAYGALGLRSAAYNLTKEYSTGAYLLNECTDDDLLSIKSACDNNEAVSEELVNKLISESLDAVSLTEDEMARFDAEMSIRFLHNASSNTAEDTTLQIQEAILLGNIEEAYNLAIAKAENGTIADAILVSEMYVRNYNQRFLAENDATFNTLLEDVTKYEIESYKIAAELGTDSKEYIRSNAQYQLALSEWNRESGKRAINYLSYCDYKGTPYELAYNLQMAKLYLGFDDKTQAKYYLDIIFSDNAEDPTQWLAADIRLLQEAYLDGSDNLENPEFDTLYCQLMRNLYQGLFEESLSSDFYTYLRGYFKGLVGGIYIGVPDISDFPTVRVLVSTIGDFEFSEDTMLITDTYNGIVEFDIEEHEIEEYDMEDVDDYHFYYLTKSGASEFSETSVRKTLYSFGLDDLSPLTRVPDAYSGFIGMADRMKHKNKYHDIVYFTDGTDGHYPTGMPGVLNRMISDGIAIHTVAFPGCNEDFMRYLSYQTGGIHFPISMHEELKMLKEEINGKYNHTYAITYTVSNPEIVERNISIGLADSAMESRRQYTSDNSAVQYSMVNDKQTSDFFKQIGGTLGGV